MEILKNTSNLRQEILKDAKKKADRILKKAEKDIQQINKDSLSTIEKIDKEIKENYDNQFEKYKKLLYLSKDQKVFQNEQVFLNNTINTIFKNIKTNIKKEFSDKELLEIIISSAVLNFLQDGDNYVELFLESPGKSLLNRNDIDKLCSKFNINITIEINEDIDNYRLFNKKRNKMIYISIDDFYKTIFDNYRLKIYNKFKN